MAAVLERNVGRKKSGDKRAGNRIPAVLVRDSAEYREWVRGLSKATMVSISDITRDALAKWAADRGLPPPPSGPGSERKPKGGGK